MDSDRTLRATLPSDTFRSYSTTNRRRFGKSFFRRPSTIQIVRFTLLCFRLWDLSPSQGASDLSNDALRADCARGSCTPRPWFPPKMRMGGQSRSEEHTSEL